MDGDTLPLVGKRSNHPMTKRIRGKREREAGKRHRRGGVLCAATKGMWLKLGHKKMLALIRRTLSSTGGG